MALELSTRINILAQDGRVRLTIRGGLTLDVRVVRWEFSPKRLLAEPIGFNVSIDGHTPEVLRLPYNQITAADRLEGPSPTPDIIKLGKALERPVELPPATSAAALKRAEKALADPGDADAVRQAIATGATKDLASAVARLDADTRKQLVELAVDTGHAAVLTALLTGATDLDLGLLLARAATAGKLGSLDALIALGADVHQPRAYGSGEARTALHRAVLGGHRMAVRRLLQAGARATAESAALAWAIVQKPDLVTWSLLLAAGLDPSARDHHGDPLLLALGRNIHLEMLDAAIAAGADVNAKYPDGSTLLLHAIDLAMSPGPSTSFISNLIKAGADPNAGRLRGRNPLALARVVLHDPGKDRGERWIARWLEQAGAVAIEEPDAPPITPDAPPPPPPWRARIDPNLRRAPHYDVAGVRFTPAPPITTDLAATTTPNPRWHGLACDDIAVVRAKLEHLVGPPPSRGDEYKTTFEYGFHATLDDTRLALQISDWKARELSLALEPHPDEALRDRIAAAFWELLTISPLAKFRDRFRVETHAAPYHSDGHTAVAEFPR